MRTLLRHLLLPSLLLVMSGCRRAPSREEVVKALRTADPAIDTVMVVKRVWIDGPAWFSCAEVIAKTRSPLDSAVVRDQVGNWRALMLADWVALRDTAAGDVVDPGWCRAQLRDEAARVAGGWRRVSGDSLPSGGLRRGWDVPAGRPKVVVIDAPKRIGKDSAVADYVITIAPNANGVALGADADSVRHRAVLRRDGGNWRVIE